MRYYNPNRGLVNVQLADGSSLSVGGRKTFSAEIESASIRSRVDKKLLVRLDRPEKQPEAVEAKPEIPQEKEPEVKEEFVLEPVAEPEKDPVEEVKEAEKDPVEEQESSGEDDLSSDLVRRVVEGSTTDSEGSEPPSSEEFVAEEPRRKKGKRRRNRS